MVEIRVDIKNRFLAFEQEGDDDVAGELLDKFNQKKEQKALKKAIKAAAKEKSRPKKADTVEVFPKTQKTGSTAQGDTGLQIDERKKKKKKKKVESVTEVVVDEGPRERVVYQGGKEFTRKTYSTFAAKMSAITREAEQSAKNNRPSRGREGFRRDREGFVKPSYEANVTATEEVSSGHFEKVPINDRLYSGRGGYRQGRAGFYDQAQHVSSSENALATVAEEASSRHVEESPSNRYYRGRGGFSQRRVGFSDQQVPSPENADAAVAEEASSSQFDEKPRSSRPYRGRGGYRGRFDRRNVETEPEVKQYTLDEWKEMQAELRKNSSLNVAKTKEGAKEKEEKVKLKNVVKQENSNTGIQIKLGTASFYGRRGRGRGSGKMDRIDFGDERRSSRVFQEAPNVSDDSSFPRLNLEELLTLLLYLFALDEQKRWSLTSKEKTLLERELVEAFMLAKKSGNSQAAKLVEACRTEMDCLAVVQDLIDKLKGLSNSKSHLQKYRTAMEQGTVTSPSSHRPIIKQVIQDILDPTKPDLVDISHKSSTFGDLIKIGFGPSRDNDL